MTFEASSNMVDSSLENVALSTDGGLYAHRIAIRLLYSCKHPAKYTQATLQIFSSWSQQYYPERKQQCLPLLWFCHSCIAYSATPETGIIVNKILLTRDRPEQFPSFFVRSFQWNQTTMRWNRVSKAYHFLKKIANCLDNILFLITVFMISKTSFQNISEMLS